MKVSSLKNIKHFFRDHRDNFLIGEVFKIYRALCDLYYDSKNKRFARKLRKKYKLDEKNYFTNLQGTKCRLAVTAIFRGEDEYLKDWIEFHRIVGVSHFFLYDNGNSSTSKAILQPYIDKGVVTYIPWPNLDEPTFRNHYAWSQFSKMSIQKLAYGDCPIQYSNCFDWIIKIDLDEYLYPRPPYTNLNQVFDIFDEENAMGAYFQSSRFGPSGHLERTGKTVIESYDMRYPQFDKNFKVAAKSGYIDTDYGFHGCHFFFFKKHADKKILFDDLTSKYIRLNHYYMKSKAEYADKIKVNEQGYLKGKENIAKWNKVNGEASYKDEGEILRFAGELNSRI